MDPNWKVIPAWLTSTVVALANGIYQERAFDRLPILADALQDAGCNNDDMLNHCRLPDITHCRTCPVIVAILGQEIIPKDTFTVLVDYSRNIWEGIIAGCYDAVDESITSKNFPPHEHEIDKKELQFGIFLFYLKTPEEIANILKRDGYRHATLRELLAANEKYPDLSKDFRILEWGSSAIIEGYNSPERSGVGLYTRDHKLYLGLDTILDTSTDDEDYSHFLIIKNDWIE